MAQSLKDKDLTEEKTKLETDRAKMNERLNALNIERDRTVSQLSAIAGAIQMCDALIDKLDGNVTIDTAEEDAVAN